MLELPSFVCPKSAQNSKGYYSSFILDITRVSTTFLQLRPFTPNAECEAAMFPLSVVQTAVVQRTTCCSSAVSDGVMGMAMCHTVPILILQMRSLHIVMLDSQ